MTSVEATALIDTGASTSGIVERIATELALRPMGKRPIYIARGQMQVERYLFRLGLIADATDGSPQFPYVFEEILGFELGDTTALPDGRRLDAIIGMDVLRHCDFRIERSGSCELAFG